MPGGVGGRREQSRLLPDMSKWVDECAFALFPAEVYAALQEEGLRTKKLRKLSVSK